MLPLLCPNRPPTPPCSLAISEAIVVGGCTPGVTQVLAQAQAHAQAAGNGSKFASVAQASAAAQCLPGQPAGRK